MLTRRRSRMHSSALLCVAGVVTALMVVPTAQAQLPGSGYTFDQYWNCGLIYSSQLCWYPGVLGYNSSYNHSWGPGSADYDGSGSPRVSIAGGTGSYTYFGADGARLARACYSYTCNDQDSVQMGMSVTHFAGGSIRHTINGHGKA